jgi:putative transcriptional regulator
MRIISAMTPIRVRLRELRKERGLSQQALADLADVRQSAISQLESGTRQRIDLGILERLARALECESINDLLVLEPEPPKPAKHPRKRR